MPVYLVDHAAFRPPDANRVTTDALCDGLERQLAAAKGNYDKPFFVQNPAVRGGMGRGGGAAAMGGPREAPRAAAPIAP